MPRKQKPTAKQQPPKTATDYPHLIDFSPAAIDALGGGRAALRSLVREVLAIADRSTGTAQKG